MFSIRSANLKKCKHYLNCITFWRPLWLYFPSSLFSLRVNALCVFLCLECSRWVRRNLVLFCQQQKVPLSISLACTDAKCNGRMHGRRRELPSHEAHVTAARHYFWLASRCARCAKHPLWAHRSKGTKTRVAPFVFGRNEFGIGFVCRRSDLLLCYNYFNLFEETICIL